MWILRKPITILVIFLGFKAIQTVYSYAIGAAPTYVSHSRFAELIIFAIVSFYAVKSRNFAIGTMGIYLLAQVFTLLGAVFIVPSEQYIFKVSTTVLSLYFVFGGIVLIQLAKAQKKTET